MRCKVEKISKRHQRIAKHDYNSREQVMEVRRYLDDDNVRGVDVERDEEERQVSVLGWCDDLSPLVL
jgi:hypothetical protein